MMCSKCTKTIENKLKNLEGIEEFKLILKEQEAFVTGDISDELLRSAIESEGYTVVGIIKLKNINLPKEEVHEDKFYMLFG